MRTGDALYRFFGRDAFGWPVGVGIHLFDEHADAGRTSEAWRVWLDDLLGKERSAA